MRVLLVSESAQFPNAPSIPHLEDSGVSVRCILLRELRGEEPRGLARKIARYRPGPEVVGPIEQAIREFDPDLVHITSGRTTALPVLRALGGRKTPILVEYGAVHGLNVLNPFDWLVYFNRRISRLVVPSRAVINNWMAQSLLRRCLGPNRCCVLPHPIPPSDPLDGAGRTALRDAYGLGAADVVVGTVCAVRPIKNLDFVADIVSRLGPPFVFVIVGSVSEGERARMQGAYGGGIRFLGPIPGARSMMGMFDIFVTPTRLPGESFGLAPGEAMAASVPVVTMNFGGTAEIVEHGVSGYALPAAASAWENALRRLASDPDLRAAMGRAAQERIRSRFAPAATARDCLALYESVLAERC